MNATALLATLRERGASVRADGDRLKVKNDAALTDSDRAAIRHQKGELLELLALETASRCAPATAPPAPDESTPESAPPVLSLVPPLPDAYEGVTGAALLRACIEAARRHPKWTSRERHDFALALARLESGADANDEKVRIAFARGHTSNGTALDYGAADELLGTDSIKKTEGGDQ